MRRAPLLCALFLLAQPASARAQLGAAAGTNALTVPSGGGVRLLSSGAYAADGGAGGALAALAASLGWPIGGAVLAADAALARTDRGRLAGAGGMSLLAHAGATRFRLRLGAGAAPDEHAGPSVIDARAVVERGGFSLSLGSNLLPSLPGTFRDTLVTVGDTSFHQRVVERAPRPRAVYADAELGYRHTLSRLEIAGVVGHRLAGDSLPRTWWAHVTSSVRVTAATAVGVTMGRQAASPWLDTRGSTFATIFVRHDLPGRARPTRAADAIGPLRIVPDASGGSGPTEFVIDVPDARTVELAGDFSEWAPVRMRRDGGTRWRIELAVAPGVHHVALRIDGGAWQAPPGLPVVPDEFGGESGVFVVR